MKFSQEVQEAMKRRDAIVALESTIISHGMPYPQNLEVAREVEEMVRTNGATPATIAVLGGEFHVGLSNAQLEHFAGAKNVIKCSRRDLPFVVSQQMDGATTVAATMIIAQMAGIRVFATGGIGGVHRDAEKTFDISADLDEFSRSSVAVVSAGAKAILDIPKTLEYLETKGVPVIGYGTNDFPAFYSRSSGCSLQMKMDNPREVADFLEAKWNLGIDGGVLIANPIPVEFELDRDEIERAISAAHMSAQTAAIGGKDLTPFLLKKVNEITTGKSQVSNRMLVLNNARIAAEIAVAFAQKTNPN